MRIRTFCLLLASATLALAQTPRFLHAKVETRPAGPNLAAQLFQIEAASAGPLWIGYSVPRVERDHGGDCGTTYLEGDHGEINGNIPDADGPQRLVILYRAANHQVDKTRTVSEACAIDAGGLPVIWLTGVSPLQSVGELSSLVPAAGEKLQNGALAAIALTDDPAADTALAGFAAASQPEPLRERAVFWMGADRGHAGFLALQALARQDGSDKLREKIAFALNLSADPAATDELIRLAKNDAVAKVREQAIFWLAQKAGKKAAATLSSVATDDPETAVKERAVFGLSQLPKDQGIPLLIHVAQTNSNPTVRKRAIFWLGQSHDPRALAFFQQLLQ